MSIRIQEQVLFELAMSMGTSLNLEKMLNAALSTYLRRLCCMGAVVFIKNEQEGEYSKVFSIPRKNSDKTVANRFLQMIKNCKTESDLAELSSSLPLHKHHDGKHNYLMNLPNAGFIMIVKGQSPLSQSMLKSLNKINTKLAESIVSCLTHRSNEILNMRLKNQIRGRKKAEEKLLAERKKYRAIFENSPLGMVYYSHEGIIKDCNQKFIQIMGSSRKKLIGFNTALNSSKKMREAIDKALNGEPATYEGPYTSITGKKDVYLRSRFNPIIPGSKNTEVIATVEEVRDTTEK